MQRPIDSTPWHKFYKNIYSQKQLQALQDFLEAPYKTAIRLNTTKTSIEDFKAIIQEYNWKLEPIPWNPEGFFIQTPDDISLGKHILHQAGYFYVQDASSQLPVTLLDINGAKVILDMCSAPGSKTTQLLNMTDHKALIIANEPSGSRLSAMTTNLARLGSSNIIATQKQGQYFGKYLSNTFDIILLDAPCSGDGMMKRDRKILNAWTPEDSLFRSKIQKQLILSAFEALKPNGQMVYSTCTFSPYENEDVIDHLKDTYGEFLETGKEHRLTPWDDNAEGFYCISIQKTVRTNAQKKVLYTPHTYLNKLDSKKEKIMICFFRKHFGIDFTCKKRHIFIESNNAIWMIPSRFASEFGMLKSFWHGLKICQIYNHTIRISYEMALCYGNTAKHHAYDLSTHEYKDITQGKDIISKTSYAEGSDIILRYKAISFGMGKFLQGKIKNNIPRNVIVRS